MTAVSDHLMLPLLIAQALHASSTYAGGKISNLAFAMLGHDDMTVYFFLDKLQCTHNHRTICGYPVGHLMSMPARQSSYLAVFCNDARNGTCNHCNNIN